MIDGAQVYSILMELWKAFNNVIVLIPRTVTLIESCLQNRTQIICVGRKIPTENTKILFHRKPFSELFYDL